MVELIEKRIGEKSSKNIVLCTRVFFWRRCERERTRTNEGGWMDDGKREA